MSAKLVVTVVTPSGQPQTYIGNSVTEIKEMWETLIATYKEASVEDRTKNLNAQDVVVARACVRIFEDTEFYIGVHYDSYGWIAIVTRV